MNAEDRRHFPSALKGVLLMICSSVFVCFGQLCWKLSLENGMLLLLTGFILYAGGALIMLYAYRFGKLSTLQPVLSMNYILSSLLGVIILGESFNLQMGIGIIVIIVGVLLLGGDPR